MKKKILLLSDDLRSTSGIATMSKEFVLGTVDKYDWVQLGAMIKHQDIGKTIDVSEDVRNKTGVKDANVKLYPNNGYGDIFTLRRLIDIEKPDAILHFTDPHYWQWLYDNEQEIRQKCPILFYHIWDNLPDPKYNRDYYESCDWLGCISKQTYGIVKRVGTWDKEPYWNKLQDWQVSYVPHGINSEDYKPVEVPEDFKKSIFGDKDYDFVLYWSNRNIRRKQPIDAMLAFEEFRQTLRPEQQDKVCMLMHTTPVDENGTDLPKVAEHLMPDANIIFAPNRYTETELNYLYNLADVTINLASNEGFGLATAESVMAGTPIIVTVTGGLQDQCGFREKGSGKLLTADDYVEIGSLHDKYKKNTHVWGDWVTPTWPVRSTTGSVPTPYIFDDRVDFQDVAPLIRGWYDMGREERKKMGLKGRKHFMSEGKLSREAMCNALVEGMEGAFANWKPIKKYNLIKL